MRVVLMYQGKKVRGKLELEPNPIANSFMILFCSVKKKDGSPSKKKSPVERSFTIFKRRPSLMIRD